MSSYTIKLKNQLATFIESEKLQGSTGFIFKCNGTKYIITTHHYLPIVNTFYENQDTIISLKKAKNIYWNELNILEYNSFINAKVVKSFRTKFEKKGNIVKLENEKFIVHDYLVTEKTPFCKIKNIYMRFLINNTDLVKYKGLSGAPIFSEDDRLVGIFCKYFVDGTNVYGLVLPTIYILKTLVKQDNTNLYKIDLNCNVIYHPNIKYKIPAEVYCNLEGDENRFIPIRNLNTKEVESKMFIKDDYFDININLEKNADDEHKFNSGLISILFLHQCKDKIREIANRYLNYKGSLNKIFIKI